MRLVPFSVFVLCTAALVACGNLSPTQPSGPPEQVSGASQPAPEPPPTSPENAPPPQDAGPAAPLAGPRVEGSEGLNPPHGQPNHRCDIPVGAPLSSPPGKTPTPAAAPVAPVVAAQPAAPGQAATAPGMNPPHGQPGHRCDIPVGAPLDSPPGKNPVTGVSVGAPSAPKK